MEKWRKRENAGKWEETGGKQIPSGFFVHLQQLHDVVGVLGYTLFVKVALLADVGISGTCQLDDIPWLQRFAARLEDKLAERETVDSFADLVALLLVEVERRHVFRDVVRLRVAALLVCIGTAPVLDHPDLLVDGEHGDQPKPFVSPADDLGPHLVVLERFRLLHEMVADAGQGDVRETLLLHHRKLEVPM